MSPVCTPSRRDLLQELAAQAEMRRQTRTAEILEAASRLSLRRDPVAAVDRAEGLRRRRLNEALVVRAELDLRRPRGSGAGPQPAVLGEVAR